MRVLISLTASLWSLVCIGATEKTFERNRAWINFYLISGLFPLFACTDRAVTGTYLQGGLGFFYFIKGFLLDIFCFLVLRWPFAR